MKRVLEFRLISSLAERIIDPNASFLFYSFFNARDRSAIAKAATLQPASVSSEEVAIKTSAELASPSP